MILTRDKNFRKKKSWTLYNANNNARILVGHQYKEEAL